MNPQLSALLGARTVNRKHETTYEVDVPTTAAHKLQPKANRIVITIAPSVGRRTKLANMLGSGFSTPRNAPPNTARSVTNGSATSVASRMLANLPLSLLWD
jgi:hypothetical protein